MNGAVAKASIKLYLTLKCMKCMKQIICDFVIRYALFAILFAAFIAIAVADDQLFAGVVDISWLAFLYVILSTAGTLLLDRLARRSRSLRSAALAAAMLTTLSCAVLCTVFLLARPRYTYAQAVRTIAHSGQFQDVDAKQEPHTIPTTTSLGFLVDRGYVVEATGLDNETHYVFFDPISGQWSVTS